MICPIATLPKRNGKGKTVKTDISPVKFNHGFQWRRKNLLTYIHTKAKQKGLRGQWVSVGGQC